MDINIKETSAEELIELLRSKRCSDHYVALSAEEKANILRELFVVRKTEVSNEMLHDFLWSNLPPAPNGDKRLSELQHKLVAANPYKSTRSAMPAQIPGYYVYTSFRALVSSSIPNAVEVAKAAYYDLCLRGKEDEIPDDDMYKFIRKLIPSVDAPNFRSVAEKMISIIVENS